MILSDAVPMVQKLRGHPEAAVPDNVPAQRKARGGEHGFTEDSLRKEGPPVPPEIKAYCLV